MKAIFRFFSRAKRLLLGSLQGAKGTATIGVGLLAGGLYSCEPTTLGPPLVKVDEATGITVSGQFATAGPPIVKVDEGSLNRPATAEFAPAQLDGKRSSYQVKSPHELSSLCDDATARNYRASLEKFRVPAFRRDIAEIRIIAATVADGITKAGVGADVWDLEAIRVAEPGTEPEQYPVDWNAESGIARIERYCELTRRYWWFERDGVVIGPDSFHQMHQRMGEMFR